MSKKQSKTKNVNQIIRSNLPHFSAYIVMSFFLSAVMRILALIPAILMKNIIDIYIPEADISAMVWNILLFGAIPLLNGLITAWYRKKTILLGRNMGHFLFAKCFEKILYQPMRYYDENNSSEMASYCRAEAMEYVLLWITDIPQLASSICVGVVIFAMLADSHLAIGLMQLLYIPVLLLPSRMMARWTQKYSARMTDNRAKTNQILSDAFRGIRFVKTMLLEKLQISKLNQINMDTVSIWGKMVALENAHGVWITTLVDSLFTGITFGLGALFIIKEEMTLGALVVILNYLPQFFGIIKEVSKMNFNYKKMLGSYGKLFEMLSMEDERDKPCAEIVFSFSDKIVFDHVKFQYAKDRGYVINDAMFEIKKGEWMGVVGESGAGKSTLFDLLLKFYVPQSGEIEIDGMNIQKIDTYTLRRNVISVAQDTFLFPGTIRENLQMVHPDASDSKLMSVLEKVKLSSLIQELPRGLDEEIGENGVQLSGGQRQRLALAQALLHECQVLILDEVTSNLDEATEDSIVETIRQLKEEEKITVIWISHRPNALKYADRVIRMEKGFCRAE